MTTSRLTALSIAIILFCTLTVAIPRGDAQEHRAVNLPGASQNLPFSDGIVAGNTLYVAGHEGTDASGKLKEGVSDQTAAALESIKQVVTTAGFEMKDVVTVNVYLADIADFAAMNEVYATFFPNPKPARTTIQAAGLVNGAKVEISAIAVRPGNSR